MKHFKDDADNNIIRLPYMIYISKPSDFLELESILRKLLQCHGNTCTFLQSAEYTALRHVVLLQRQSINDNNTMTVLYIPKTNFYLKLLDCNVIIVQELDDSQEQKQELMGKKRDHHGDIIINPQKNVCLEEGDIPQREQSQLLQSMENKFISARLNCKKSYYYT